MHPIFLTLRLGVAIIRFDPAGKCGTHPGSVELLDDVRPMCLDIGMDEIVMPTSYLQPHSPCAFGHSQVMRSLTARWRFSAYSMSEDRTYVRARPCSNRRPLGKCPAREELSLATGALV